MTALVLIMVFAFAAFTVDIGLMTIVKSQLQTSSDSASLAASADLAANLGVGATQTAEQTAARVQKTCRDMAALHRAGEEAEISLRNADIRLGRYSWDSVLKKWTTSYGVPPYNLVEVSSGRLSSNNNALPLFFAPLIQKSHADLTATAAAAVLPGGGFRLPAGSNSTCELMPFTVDLETWEYLLNVIRGNTVNGADGLPLLNDQYSFDSTTGQVLKSPDGIPEINIYPHTDNSLPAGNRGTIDIGPAGNSTNDLKRQIAEGVNADDLSYFPNNELRIDDGPITLNGDTGISAGIKDALASAAGQVRAIAVFSNVYGSGNTAQYEVVKFVGIRIMSSSVSGSPAHRGLYVQPTPLVSGNIIPGRLPFSSDSIMTRPRLVK